MHSLMLEYECLTGNCSSALDILVAKISPIYHPLAVDDEKSFVA